VKRIFICAENVHQARALAEAHDLRLSAWTYLSGPERLFGARQPLVWLWGTYHRHPYWREFQTLFKTVQARVFAVLDDRNT
jgi:hypothetical protein